MMKTEVLHFNEGGLLGDIQHHMPGTARRFDASLRLNGQPLQLPDRMGWGMGWGCRFVGGKTRHFVWMLFEMGEDGRSKSEVASFFEMWICLLLHTTC